MLRRVPLGKGDENTRIHYIDVGEGQKMSKTLDIPLTYVLTYLQMELKNQMSG